MDVGRRRVGDGTARRKGTRQQTVGQNKERMESPAGPSGEEGSGNGGGKHGHGFVGNRNLQQPSGTGFPLTWPAHKRTRLKKRAPVAAPDRQPQHRSPRASPAARPGRSEPRARRSRDGPRRSHRPTAPTRRMRRYGAPLPPPARPARTHRAPPRRALLGIARVGSASLRYLSHGPRFGSEIPAARSPRALSGPTRRCPSAERLGAAGRVRSPLPPPSPRCRPGPSAATWPFPPPRLRPPRGTRSRSVPSRRNAEDRQRTAPPAAAERVGSSAGNAGVRPRCGVLPYGRSGG